jgi:major membrane immunogen (membrane-anchored lipoprotein)
MRRATLCAAMAAAVALLAACGEKPQTNAQGVKYDAAPWTGTSTGSNAGTFSAAGWQPGDKKAWEQQLKTRAQNGQNDYVRDN